MCYCNEKHLSYHNFVQNMKADLLWHVQNCVLTRLLESKYKH